MENPSTPRKCSCGSFFLPEPGRRFRTCPRCRSKANAYHLRLRNRALLTYGGRCSECGAARLAYLQVFPDDPTNLLRGTNLHLQLHQDDYPPGYRVICQNCTSLHSAAQSILPDMVT